MQTAAEPQSPTPSSAAARSPASTPSSTWRTCCRDLHVACACETCPPCCQREPAPARVAASPCGAAIELTKSLRSEGRLDRAARTLERVIPSCNGSEQSVARALQREVLVELGPGPVSKAQQAEPLAPLREPDAAMVKGDAQAALAAYESAWKKQPWHAQALRSRRRTGRERERLSSETHSGRLRW